MSDLNILIGYKFFIRNDVNKYKFLNRYVQA